VNTDSNFVFTAGVNDSVVWDPDGAGPGAAKTVSLITDGGLNAGQAYSGQDVAAALKKALGSTAASNDTYNVQYDLAQNKFNITNTAGNSNPISINWTNAGSTAANVLGFSTDSNLAVGQQATADAASAFNIIAGTNDQFQITSNPPGGPAQAITVPPGNYTGAQLASAIQTGLDTAFAGHQVSVAFNGTGFNFINQESGNASTLSLTSPAGNTLLSSLGLPAGNYNATGSGSADANNVLYVSEDNGARGISVTIPAGNYTNWQLANTIQKQLDGTNSPLKGTYTVAVDDTTGTFSINETSGQHTFALDKSRGTADETLGFTANQAGYGSVRKSDTPAFFSITVPANSSFLLTVDGISSDPIKIDPGRYDSNGLMREIYSKINGDPGAVPPIPGDPKLGPLNNVQVNYDPKVGFVLKSGTSGHNSTITVAPDNITPGAVDFLQTISLDSSTARHGVDSTRLSDLNSGAGVSPGKVAFTDMSGDTATIDFSQAVTMHDVVNAINNYGGTHPGSTFSLKASLSGNNKNLVLTDTQPTAKGVIQVQEGSAGTTTAKDLGLLGVSNEGAATYTGTDLNPNITRLTAVDVLGGGTGLSDALKRIQVNLGAKSADFDLTSAVTVGDLLDILNKNDISLYAGLNDQKKGIDLSSLENGKTLYVEEEQKVASAGYDPAVNGKQWEKTAALLGVKGSSDTLGNLFALRDALANNDQAAINKTIDPISAGSTRTADVNANIGARSTRLDATNTYMDTLSQNMSTLLGNVEYADMTTAITDLLAQQQNLQAAMSSSTKIMSLSIVNFIQ
ncbi:MAG: hypothetical protein HQK60_03710, partial [Deltaproteobacteria bacterium]|nr:hypothetical protein [Deltaproteobacteria bacterium]